MNVFLTDVYHFFALRIKLTDPAAEPHFAKKLACGYLSTVMVHATKHHVPGLPIRTHHEVEARLSTGESKDPAKMAYSRMALIRRGPGAKPTSSISRAGVSSADRKSADSSHAAAPD